MLETGHPAQCPHCLQPNRCALPAGATTGTCWCHSLRIDPAVLAALPAGERGQRCLCRDCAQGKEASSEG